MGNPWEKLLNARTFRPRTDIKTFDGRVGVTPKVATRFFPKWPHITLQTGHSISLESGQSADFKTI